MMRDDPMSAPIIAINVTSSVDDLSIHFDPTAGPDPLRICGQSGRGKHIGGL